MSDSGAPSPSPRRLSRRDFLIRTAAGAVLLLGGADLARAESVSDPLPNGRFLGLVPFTGEDNPPMNTVVGQGLDGRLYTDLSGLTPQTLKTPVNHFYVRTRQPDELDTRHPLLIRISGPCDLKGKTIPPSEIDKNRVPCGTHVMECSGHAAGAHFGMLSCASWEGFPMSRLLGILKPAASVTRVFVSGFDRHSQPSTNSIMGADWVFTFEQLKRAFLATRMNGAPLTPDHGSPVRLLVPDWYGCSCIKWVQEIRFTDDSEPATSQMVEDAGRTHQDGVPSLAKDYHPASIQLAAMPIRIERWKVNGNELFRVVGIQWGQGSPTTKLVIRFAENQKFVPVDHCFTSPSNLGWSLWTHIWRPTPGDYQIQLLVSDPRIPARRLHTGFYTREVTI